MNVMVLGAGLVGAPMAMDIALDSGFKVCVSDIDDKALDKLADHKNIKTIKADLSDENELKYLVRDYPLIINAVPGFMGFQTLKMLIEEGKNVVDIAFFPEDPLELDELARKNGVTVLVDCGVAPGMSNILTAYARSQMDACESAVIYVGGLPEKREWPWEYKAVFSPADVLEEYIRPAYFVVNGKLVKRAALSDPEYVDFPEVGTLEAFNTDGLRTLAKTMDIPNMKEKTLRYPGHIEKIKVLRESGFFSQDKIMIQGVEISPLDFTSTLLFPKWKLDKGEADLTVMKIQVKGIKDGQAVQYTYDLLDRYDDQTGIHSMARTTGYTATAITRLLAKGLYQRPGVSPPEYLGKETECVDFIFNELKQRGIFYRKTIQVHSETE